VLWRQSGRQERVVASHGRPFLPCQSLHPCKLFMSLHGALIWQGVEVCCVQP
jgi:hypothetical protein